jgi:glycerol-3-phosphate dehydrogenase
VTNDRNVSSQSDCLIIGGGVAGLWLRWRLRRAGLRVTLLDLGRHDVTRQSVASQGILHRGVKYSLSPAAAGAQRVLAEALSDWTAAISGLPSDEAPPLRGVTIHTRTMHMWAVSGLLSGMTGAAASLALVSGVRKLDPSAAPPLLASPGFTIWETDETCVDPASLLTHLRRACDGPLLAVDSVESIDAAAGVVRVMYAGASFTFSARSIFACAGLGNEHLLRAASLNPDDYCQRRPLHMVMASPAPAPLFAHCIKPLSDKPRLTITTATREGRPVWYIGGELAESGVHRTAEAQIVAARDELRRCLPAANLSDVRFAPWRIDRAEGRTPDGSRPDGPVIRTIDRLNFIWPTKLALAPIAARRAADISLSLFGGCDTPRGMPQPTESPSLHPLPPLPSPPEHIPPWQDNTISWSKT